MKLQGLAVALAAAVSGCATGQDSLVASSPSDGGVFARREAIASATSVRPGVIAVSGTVLLPGSWTPSAPRTPVLAPSLEVGSIALDPAAPLVGVARGATLMDAPAPRATLASSSPLAGPLAGPAAVALAAPVGAAVGGPILSVSGASNRVTAGPVAARLGPGGAAAASPSRLGPGVALTQLTVSATTASVSGAAGAAAASRPRLGVTANPAGLAAVMAVLPTRPVGR